MTAVRQATTVRGLEQLRIFWALRTDPLGSVAELARHGDVVRSRIPGLDAYVVHRPEDVERVLVSNQDNYVKGVDYELFAVVLGRGLVTSSGELWRRQRRLIQPLVAARRLGRSGEHMTAAAGALVARWDEELTDGAGLDIADAMMGVTLDIAGRALFGGDLTGPRHRVVASAMDVILAELGHIGRSPMTWAAQALPGMTMDRALHLHPRHRRRLLAATAQLDAIVEELIASRSSTAARREQVVADDDLLSHLLAARDAGGAAMDARQVRDEVVTFLMAGHETTASTLTWLWWLLATNPGARDRLQSEVDAVLQGRPPALGDLDRLPWTRATILETLRLYPPLWVLVRQVREDDVLSGVRVPAGATVLVATAVTQRDPRSWPAPDRFDPARFLEGPAAAPGGHVPFSAGRRGCVGKAFALAETMIVAATVAQRWTLDAPSDARVAAAPTLTLRPLGPVPLRACRRGA